jgi:hypothetical protein
MSEKRFYYWDPDNPEVDEDDHDKHVNFLRDTDKLPFLLFAHDMEDKPCQTQQCTRCEGTLFHIGQGTYHTVVRCLECKWEICIHDG